MKKYKNQTLKYPRSLLLGLYSISYPTLRGRLRLNGLEKYIGRKKLFLSELQEVLQKLGWPFAEESNAKSQMTQHFLTTHISPDFIAQLPIYSKQKQRALMKERRKAPRCFFCQSVLPTP